MFRSKGRKSTESCLRLNLVLAAIFVLTGFIVFRLFVLQVVNYNFYTALAAKQHQIWSELQPKRGEIFLEDSQSRNRYILAANKDFGLIYAVPREIQDVKKISSILSNVLGIAEEDLFRKLSKKNDLYEPLKHRVGDDLVEKIKKLNLRGIGIQKETWRYYPEKNFAAHLLGFLGYEGDKLKGRYGVEGFYNNILEGKAGFIAEERGARGAWISVGRREIKPQSKGADLVLTIDRTIQYKAETSLKKAVEKWGAEKGSIIIINPKNGEILALANFPAFDPNEYFKVKQVNLFNNSAIFDLYEPGSIFKPIVMGIALETGAVTPSTVYTDPCSVKIGRFTITNYDYRCYGRQNMTNVLEKSINTGMVFVAQRLGVKRLLNGLKKFGLDDLTGIDLDTEARARLRPEKEWRETNLATAGFGQGIAVTPLQIAAAFSAIANQGKILKPHIVKEIIHHHQDGSQRVEKIVAQEAGQALSSSAASKLSAMLISAVENGFGKPAMVEGYHIGGKTGTAQVPDKVHGGYDQNKRITSFVGFGPYEDPRFVILIKMDNPQGYKGLQIVGANTCAPVFRELAKFLFDYYKIPPAD